MSVIKDLNRMFNFIRNSSQKLNPSKGSVLVYLIVLILIFGVLGTVMISLFTTATTSSALPNDARRARHMAESAVRYAFSELRHSKFSPDVFETLTTTNYNVKDVGSFTINPFSPWFRSDSDQPQATGETLLLTVPTGKLPTRKPPNDFIVPDNLSIINFEATDQAHLGSTCAITNYTKVNNKEISFTVSDDFNALKDERVCLLFRPSHGHQVSEGGDLFVESAVKDFFPRYNGSVNINQFDYSYDRLIFEPQNNRVRLTNITSFRFRDPPYGFPLAISVTDNIVLSPRNYIIVPQGTSGPASYGGFYEFGEGLYDYGADMSAPPDIDADEFTDSIRETETGQSFLSTNPAADTLNIGGGLTPVDLSEFGAGWYRADKSIGGNNNFCTSGRCFFGLGIRVFFILKFINGLQGDGLTFTVMNAEGREASPPFNPLNDVNSVGGDFQLSELMGYAGDSRLADGGFLDPTVPRGIQPPKIAVEFDTRTNFDALFEIEPEPKNFCIDPLNLRTDTRNDPLSGNQDAIQYVFWGDSGLNVPCRTNPSDSPDTYDDNRHGIGPPETPNDRDIGITSSGELDSSVDVDSSADWLNGSVFKGPWAVRIEIEREEFLDAGGNFVSSRYTIKTWLRQCATDPDSTICTDANIIGFRAPYQNTRLEYDFSPIGTLPIFQQIELTEDEHNDFDRFFFGFTGAAGIEALDAEISQFQLSFIRLGDPVVTNDPNWTP